VAKAGTINSANLQDPTWLIAQIAQLCQTKFQRAFDLYKTAMKHGLKICELPSAECEALYSALITSAIRVGQEDTAYQLFEELRQQGLCVSPGLFSSATKLCTSKHLFAESLAIYDCASKDPKFEVSDKSIWSCLLFCAIESKAFHRCSFFFERLQQSGTPSMKDYGHMVRLASINGDWQLALKMLQDMASTGVEPDGVIFNTALATCVSADHLDQARELLDRMETSEDMADVITYNTLMKGYAKAGKMDKCFDLFESMSEKKIQPSQVTYGILLDGCINAKSIDKAAEVFDTMNREGCPMNTVLFTTLIKGFVRAHQLDQAMAIFQKMGGESGATPDLITFSILIKANCDTGRFEDALVLLDNMLRIGLQPDEVVFNMLLAGCVQQSNASLGKRVYKDMVASGIQPSNATFSILIRLYAQCKLLDEAVDLLRHEADAQKLQLEPRLFAQLIQCCLRERQGRRACEVYELMCAQAPPPASAHNNMLSACVKLNMLDTGAEILRAAANHGARVDATDANFVLNAAIRKKKMDTAEACRRAMALLGLPERATPPTSRGGESGNSAQS